MQCIIVENDKDQQKKIKNVLIKACFNDNILSIKTFEKLDEELKKIIEDTSEPKLYILDIELDGKESGINIAQRIRNKDWECFIIFVTSHDRMFESVYRSTYEVFDFIEKYNNMEAKLLKDLQIICEQNFDNKLFKYENHSVCLNIYLKDILYIERDTVERKIIIHTNNNKFWISMNLCQILKELDDRFKQVHKSCIVNRQRVEKYNWAKSEFTLDTGEVVALLSRKYKYEVKNDRASN